MRRRDGVRVALLFILGLALVGPAWADAPRGEWDHFGFSLANHGLFLVPPLVWNLVFLSRTPEYYSQGSVPPALEFTENVLRLATFVAPWFVPIDPSAPLFYPGLTVYSVGLGAYFASWVLLMAFPDLEVSQNRLVRLLPAVTPLVWLVGMGMMAGAPVSYGLLSSAFVATHVGEYAFRFELIHHKF